MMKQVIKVAESNWSNNIGVNNDTILKLLIDDTFHVLKVVNMLKHPQSLEYKSNGNIYTGIEAIKAIRR